MKVQLDSLTQRVTDPIRSSLNPPFVPNYDVQSERINLNSPSREITDRVKASKRNKVKQEPTIEDVITDPFAGSPTQGMVSSNE